MKKIAVFSIALAAIAMVSCKREEIGNNTLVKKTFSASLDQTKAYVDETLVKWSENDKVAIYDSKPDAHEFTVTSGKGTTTATISGEVCKGSSRIYTAVSPYAAARGISGDNVTVTVPSVQTAGANNIDESALVMVAQTIDNKLKFNNVNGVFKINVDVDDIKQIRIRTNDGSALAGTVTVNPETGVASIGNVEGASSEIVLNPSGEIFSPGVYYVAALPVEAAGITVDAYASTDMGYEKIAAKPLALKRNGQVSLGLVSKGQQISLIYSVEACETTSSTACFSWTLGQGADFDKTQAWTIQCSSAADFAKATEYKVPANSDVWDGKTTPKFCFGGLAQNTIYYFRVKSGDGTWSRIVGATTTAYDKSVDTSKHIFIAEDFASLERYGEEPSLAAGVDKNDNFVAHWSSYTISNGSKTSELPDSLKNWGFARGSSGSANLYVGPGYFKLGTREAQSYLVSPELNAIPEGKTATLRVTLTLAAYREDNTRVTKFFVSSETGIMSVKGLFTPDVKTTNKVEGDLVSDGEERSKWVTYTVTLSSVKHGERLMIGATTDAGNNRIQVSDVRVVEALIATATEASSSTVSFTWGYESASGAQDANRNYEFGLYRDQACTDLVVSHRTDAQADVKGFWKARKPKFCFGGLDPETTYYFKVKDVDAGIESEVVSSTTSAFTNVTMPTSAAVNDIILAEDFSQVILGGEPVIAAASACAANNEASVYKTLSGEFPVCVFLSDTDEKGLRGEGDTHKANTRLKDWSYVTQNEDNAVYSHVGCIKMGINTNKTWLTTPILSAIPDGKKADLEITVTLAAYTGATPTAYVYAVVVGDKAEYDAGIVKQTSSEILTEVGTWTTSTVTLSGVENTMRLMIGPGLETANNKGRMMVNDVIVKITALK